MTPPDDGRKPDPLGGLGGGALPPDDPHGPHGPHDGLPHGHPPVQGGPPQPRESAAVKFRRVRQVAPMTASLLGVLAFAFVLQCWAGGWSTSDPQALFRLGALSWATVENGDWWRLGSYAFLHVGLPHFFLNAWALWILMRPLEGVFGAAGALGLWAAGALAGGVASMYWARHGGNPMVIAAGASGGIMGLFGARVGLVLRLRKRLDPLALKAEVMNLLLTLVLNAVLAVEAATGGLPLDNAAHLGGLLSGALFALAMPIPALGVKLGERLAGALLLSCAFVLAAMEGAAVARAVHPHNRALRAAGFTAELPWQLVPLPAHEGWAQSLALPIAAAVAREAEPFSLEPGQALPDGSEVVHLGDRAWLHQRYSGAAGTREPDFRVLLVAADGAGRVRVDVECNGRECAPLAESTAALIARTYRPR